MIKVPYRIPAAVVLTTAAALLLAASAAARPEPRASGVVRSAESATQPSIAPAMREFPGHAPRVAPRPGRELSVSLGLPRRGRQRG